MVQAAEQSSFKKAPIKRKISWETFQKNYLTREDKYKYEWVDGYVQKTKRTMDKNQFYILVNLMKFLDSLRPNLKQDWQLIPEGDTFFRKKHRRPDMAFYTLEQIRKAKENENIVPEFLIEVISTNDQINLVDEKMDNYRAAKVKVVWHIFPKSEKVHVYHGKKMVICEKEDFCSAEAVIPGFKIKAEDIFK